MPTDWIRQHVKPSLVTRYEREMSKLRGDHSDQHAIEEDIKKLNPNEFLGIDCGLDNLLTTYDAKNKKSIIIDGKPLKSINQHYNKTKGKLQ